MSFITENVVILWSGSLNTIPSGWFICDGTNNTPDLRDKFVVGAGDTYSFNSTGGFADAIVPPHGHTVVAVNSGGSHGHTGFRSVFTYSPGTQQMGIGQSYDSNNFQTRYTSSTANSFPNHSHTGGTVNDAGVSATNANLPPYLSLFYIMRGGN